MPLLAGAFAAAILLVALIQAARLGLRRRAQGRLVESELQRLGIRLPQIDVAGLAAGEPIEDPDKPADSAVVHTASAGVDLFGLANLRGIEVQIVQSGVLVLTAVVLCVVLLAASPFLFEDAEKTGNLFELGIPFIGVFLLYFGYLSLWEGLILRSGDRYLIVDQHFLFLERSFRRRGASPGLRRLLRFRRGARYDWPCLSFRHAEEKVMIPGVEAADVAWIKGVIERRQRADG